MRLVVVFTLMAIWLALLVGLASAAVWAHVKAVARDRRRRLRGAAPRELARAARRRGH